MLSVIWPVNTGETNGENSAHPWSDDHDIYKEFCHACHWPPPAFFNKAGFASVYIPAVCMPYTQALSTIKTLPIKSSPPLSLNLKLENWKKKHQVCRCLSFRRPSSAERNYLINNRNYSRNKIKQSTFWSQSFFGKYMMCNCVEFNCCRWLSYGV